MAGVPAWGGEGRPRVAPPVPAVGAAATPAAPEALVLPEIDWWAVNQSFAEEKGAIILSGSAWVRYKSIKLEADHIVFFRETRELYAEGHIRLREGESELSAEVAYLDMVNERGYLVDATLRVSAKGGATPGGGNILRARQDLAQAYAKGLTGQAGLVSIKDPYGVYLTTVDDPQSRMNFVFKAEKIVRDGHLFYYAENAFLTNDDMAEPLYGIKVKRLEFECMDAPDPSKPDKPDATYVKPKLIRGRGAQLKIGPLTLFPFPTITYDLTKPLGYMRYDWGQSSYYGYYLLFRVGWGLGGAETKQFNPARLYIDADLRQKRGPALGTEFRWKTGARPEDPEARAAFEQGAGHVRLYGLDEIFTTSSDDLSRAARNRDRRLLPKFDGDPRRKYDANLLFVARRKADGAGPASAQLDRYADDQRWLVDFAHHQPLRNVAGLSDVQLDFLYQRQSDRDFMLEYYDHNYLLMNQPEALASARKAGDNYSVELLYRTDPQEFDGVPPRSPVAQGAFTSYEPAFTYSLLPYALPKGFYVSGEAQVAKLGRSFERELVDQSDFDSGRVYGKVSLERPFTWCGWQFRPQVGGQAAAYDQSRDGGSLTQAAATWGVDVSKRFYGDFPDLTNEELGLHGFRHIVEPRLQYSGISTTTEDPLKVLDFDEVDDLRGLQRVRVGLDQFFQTGRHTADGTFAGSDIAGLNTYLDLYPGRADRNRLLEGAWSDLLNVNGYLNVTGNVSLYGALGYSLSDSRVETANLGLTIDPKGRWRLSVSERFNYRDKDRLIVGSDQTYVRFEFQLSERWGLIFDQVNQRTQSLLDIKGVQTQIVTLTRRYGPVIGQVSYHIDNTRKDHGYNFSLAPAFAYRNLVVPTQDLLVESTEVGEAEETPEERNFDPFQLIHLKGKKTAPQKPSATPPPAPGSTPAPSPSPRPAPTGTGPVPAPPAEVVPMDDGPRGPAAGPAAGPVPPTPKPGPAPARVDQDDWAAYPTAGTNP